MSHRTRIRETSPICAWVLVTLLLTNAPAFADRIESRPVMHEARNRTYHVQTPNRVDPKRPLPLVVVLHGGAGNGRGIIASYGFTPFVNRGQLIALYPDALNGSWAVGGVPTANKRLPGPNHDDIGFIDKAVDEVLSKLPIDRQRLFVTGASRGGHMTQFYVPRSRHPYRGGGVVISSGTRSVVASFRPRRVFDFGMIIGTEDPLMPYEGSPHRDPRAELMPVDEIMATYRGVLGTRETPAVSTTLDDRNPRDGCTSAFTLWRNPQSGARLALWKVIGGGHVTPGNRQYLPVSVIGRACSDFNHAEVMWQFFSEAIVP